MNAKYRPYKPFFIAALVLHVLLATVLFVDMKTPIKTAVVHQQPKVDIVKAVTLDQKQVTAEINKLKAERQAKAKQQQSLLRQAEQAKKQKQLEQARLNKLQKQLKAAKKTYKAEQRSAAKKLAQLKQKQHQEQQRLADIKRKAEAAKQRRIAEVKAAQKEAEKQKRITQAKQAKAQKEAETKRSIAEALKAAQAKLKAEKQAEQARVVRTRQQREIDRYKMLITQAIGRRWLVPSNVDQNITCKLLIRLGDGGIVLNVKLIQSSGNPILDRSAQAAVYKASPLPVPSDVKLFEKFRVLNLTVRPEGVLS